MKRIKWVRLVVQDLGDVVRWASAQNAREIGRFRYRVIHGREVVSFRLVPDYAIQIGPREITVVAHVRRNRWRLPVKTLRPEAGQRQVGEGPASAVARLAGWRGGAAVQPAAAAAQPSSQRF